MWLRMVFRPQHYLGHCKTASVTEAHNDLPHTTRKKWMYYVVTDIGTLQTKMGVQM